MKLKFKVTEVSKYTNYSESPRTRVELNSDERHDLTLFNLTDEAAAMFAVDGEYEIEIKVAE